MKRLPRKSRMIRSRKPNKIMWSFWSATRTCSMTTSPCAKCRVPLAPEQQAEVENFRKTEAQVKIKLKEERKKLRRDIDALENRLKWFNIAAMPLVVSASGLTLAFYKRKRTSAK